MRPNTSESGIFSTNRSSAVSVSILTRMLVPKPKKAFQSPGVQRAGAVIFAGFMTFSSPSGALPRLRDAGPLQSRNHFFRAGHPAEDSALGLDHVQAHLVE